MFAVKMVRKWWEGLVHASYLFFGGGVRGEKEGTKMTGILRREHLFGSKMSRIFKRELLFGSKCLVYLRGNIYWV